MNKYVWRTSLVWLVLFVVAAVVSTYRSGARKEESSTSATNEVQPIAAGPSPVSSNAEQSVSETERQPTAVQLTPERMQAIGVKTGTVEYKDLSDDIRATGTVDIDERLVSYVQIRFPGYIHKVFADSTYQPVRKGEPLFTVYSPDLVATQQEYLLARQNEKVLSQSSVDGVATGAASLSEAAEQRLAQWEVPPGEIAKLKNTGKPITDLTINSPVSGYITERNALPNMYVEPSTRLYTVADLSHVWVYAQVFQGDISRVKPRDKAQITVDSYPGRVFSGTIEDILPQVDLATRTVRVRLSIANPGLTLKAGMFVNVDLKSNLGRQLVVPASAVLETGTKQLVFLNQGDGSLQPKEVTLGPRVGDYYVVLAGLKAHQSIVTSAGFLIDSESQLQAATGSFQPPPPGAGANAAASPNQSTIDFASNPSPPRKGENVFHVHLKDQKGSPISGAQVTATFYMAAMPAMGMAAMQSSVTFTEKGNGAYEGTGTLQSGGTWQVTLRAQRNGQTIVAKQFSLTATGGM